MLPVNTIVQGSVLDVLKDWPDNSINCCITSPPYWALRAYGTEPQVWGGRDCEHKWGKDHKWSMSGGTEKTNVGNFKDDRIHAKAKSQFCSLCGAWRGELGLEPTPELYIEHLMMVFDGVKRVLRKDGVLFVNIADTYAGGGRGGGGCFEKMCQSFRRDRALIPQSDYQVPGIPAKSLCAIPERFVLAMMAHGWIRRCTIIWAKGLSFCETYSGSCMPDSCKDRPNKNAFEFVYMFTRSKKYYYEQQYEDAQELNAERPRMGQGNQTIYKQKRKEVYRGQATKDYTSAMAQNPSDTKRRVLDSMRKSLGRTIRNVWAINPQAYPEAHFATFPEKLVEPLIKMGTPEFVCKKCGKARVKIYGVDYQRAGGKGQEKYDTDNQSGGLDSGACTPQSMKHGRANKITTEVGYTDCGCNAGFRPGVVFDPFSAAARPHKSPQDSEGTGLVLSFRRNISRWRKSA